ncbi:hypothetical protein TNCV_1171081 [Trichonephila clavipes]|nr:hypothetical protein TNCV_1171081 [Trichonephila clavipes]
MSSRHHIDDFMGGRIIGKIEEGRKITDVARDGTGEVVLEVRRLQKTRYIVLSAKGTGAPQRSRQISFFAASGKQISRKTVARRLRGGGLYARRPVVCVPLTRQHRTVCFGNGVVGIRNWTEQDWGMRTILR